MNSFKSAYLPLRSPHTSSAASFPFPQSVPPSVLALLRNRLYLSLSLFAFVSLLFITYAASPFTSKHSSHSPSAFPSNGLHKGLWEQLNAIQWRELALEPVEVPWTTETTMDQHVPWFADDLIPKGKKTSSPVADGGKSGVATAPRHRLDVFPRRVVLPKDAPRPDKLMFGIVTTVERAKMMSALWTRWLVPPEGEDSDENRPACLILLSKDEEKEDVESLGTVLKSRGLKCGVRQSEQERYEVRVLSMTVEMRDYAADLGREFEWYIFNDDDTFWVDLRTLRRMLSKYDSSKDWFVGATTEAKNQLESFGRMAFGGAGMLVSDPLSLKMYNLWDDCFEKFRHIFGGDEMITRCAAVAKGQTKQTVTSEEKGLHQFDIPGDTTGVLQSGIPFLNLHHYIGGTWVHLFGYGSYRTDYSQITLLKRVMEFLGGDNMFKRYVFGDGKWLMVQGYSLTIFEEPLKPAQLAKMEHTWYEGYRLSYPDRPPVPERHDWDGLKVKQTFYIWDEHLTSSERVRFEVLWDGCWQGGNGCEEKTELRLAT
ncbi:hypothetical protein RQP46_008432 [Phenoliferia psychrophenolica]